ncbi:MAG: AMP-binding protein [Rhodoferax sp.]|uniref:AMP-binding protein n=1 Tax=Rhodoferax sp. TaxID=50421 RepID=UPI002609034C|nr:AMP-binding protein [Rhodoferax sp.]MDD5334004.1 AMP-binding protein [Rhodoferax sp.]
MPTPIAVAAGDLPLPCFYRWERQRANQVYLTQPTTGGAVQDLTWSQAGDQVRRMASWLQTQAWPIGSRVAIIGKNSAHWVLADLAIQMAGHVSVPLYPTFNGEALSYVLAHCEARACFVGKMDEIGNLQTGLAADLPVIALPLAPAIKALRWSDLIASSLPMQESPTPDGESVCTIIYTSGTTGKPKGAVHTFNTIAWGVSSATRRVRMSSDDRYLSYLPLAHVAERMLIEQGSLRYGGHIFFAEALDTFVQDLQRARPTIFFSVPRLWVKFQQGVHAKMPAAKLKRLLALPLIGWLVRRKILKGLGLDQCRIAAGGAAPMPADVLHWYRDLGLDLIEVYGMTENCAISHSTMPGSSRTGTVGLPYDGVEQRIDPNSGEIEMRSAALMKAYYREPEQTAAAITADGWLRTGDKGDIAADGYLSITGRVKDIFKTGKGKYVAPAPIEDLLVMHPDIEACVVTGAALAQPLALVMLSQDAVTRCATGDAKQALTESLELHLKAVNARLEPHERLGCLVVVTTPWTPENGFVTPTLKVKRNRIEEAFAGQYQSWSNAGKPVIWLAD